MKVLVLRGGHGTEIPFSSQMSSEAAGAALAGTQGWLLWHPGRRRGRDVPTDLVGDDGWQLPGAVPVPVTERIAKEGLALTAHPDPHRRVRTLDLGAGWPVTASLPVLAGWTVALGCLAALVLVPEAGDWRWWTAAGGLLVPVLGLLAQGMAPEAD